MSWSLERHGRTVPTDEQSLRRGLLQGRLTGFEWVRRGDGVLAPLFGQIVFKEVCPEGTEPRWAAEARLDERLTRLHKRGKAATGGGAVLALTGVVGPPWMWLAGVGAGLLLAWALWTARERLWLVRQRERTRQALEPLPIIHPPPA